MELSCVIYCKWWMIIVMLQVYQSVLLFEAIKYISRIIQNNPERRIQFPGWFNWKDFVTFWWVIRVEWWVWNIIDKEWQGVRVYKNSVFLGQIIFECPLSNLKGIVSLAYKAQSKAKIKIDSYIVKVSILANFKDKLKDKGKDEFITIGCNLLHPSVFQQNKLICLVHIDPGKELKNEVKRISDWSKLLLQITQDILQVTKITHSNWKGLQLIRV